MGPELADKEASIREEKRTVVEVENHTCVSNFQDLKFQMDTPLVEEIAGGCGGENGNVDILGSSHVVFNDLVMENPQEMTESSSSFENIPGVENGAPSSDAEVVSDFRESAPTAASFDEFGDVFTKRKKRLTSHWREFIQPLLWRCKWVELQTKKLKFQACQYDRVLAENSRKDLFQAESSAMDFGTKSIPFSCGNQRSSILRRKKRRRIEETTDAKAYMSKHSLFSYFENSKVSGNATSLDDERVKFDSAEMVTYNDETGVDNGLLWLQSGQGDESWEQMLCKIGTVQGQVRQLKCRLEKVKSDNASMFAHVGTSLLEPCDALMSPARDPASSPNGGHRMAAGSSISPQLTLPCSGAEGDKLLPEKAVSCHGEVAQLPDRIGSTDQHHVGSICHNADDHLNNGKVKEEMNNSKEVKIQSVEGAQLTERKENPVVPVHAQQDPPTNDQPASKVRSMSKLTAPKIKRRKGRRKFASGRRRRS